MTAYRRLLGESSLRVVLADDEAAIRSLTKYWLESDGRFTVVGEARDGSECIRLCENEQPDIVLLDLVMPRMGGLPALPAVRQAAPQSKIVVLSMLQEERSIQESLDSGADAFLDKGIDGSALVERLLEIWGPKDQPRAAPATRA